MKTQLSRNSHRPGMRYSGVYQQQGRMLTDADWNELTDIVKQRLEDALRDVVAGGGPRTGGLVDVTSSPPSLRWGRVYVDGVPAEVRPAPGAGPTFAFHQQADFPGVEDILPPPAFIYYLDVWERPVISIEDVELRDPGLHGADTCSRTQTMAQVKWCAVATDPMHPGANPQKGDAECLITERVATTGTDPCDPCAREVVLERGSGNYLFRVEVHAVEGPADAPTRVVLKWSSENGAEQHAVGTEPAGFKRPEFVYEFCNGTTEKQLGVHLDKPAGFPTRAPLFDDGYPAAPPAGYPYVRRWDGCCDLRRGAGGWALHQGKDRGVTLTVTAAPDADAGQGEAKFEEPPDGTPLVVKLFLTNLRIVLTLVNRRFVAGDFWLAVVREHAPAGQRVRSLSTVPLGIVHHYLRLLTVVGGVAQALSDNEHRRHSFPPLANLTADRVGYDAMATELRWRDIIDDSAVPLPATVQQAFDRLVLGLESSDIRYDPDCPGGLLTVNSLMATVTGWPDLDADGRPTVRDMLRAFLCHLDAAHMPYLTGAPDTLQTMVELQVDSRGDTMTGDLTINANLLVHGSGTPTPAARLAVLGGLHVGGDSDPGDNNLLVEGDCTIAGSLTVQGTTTTLNTATLDVEDPIIQVNRYAPQATPLDVDAGIEVFRGGTAPKAQLLWDEGLGEWTFGLEGSLTPIARRDHRHFELYRPDLTTQALGVDPLGRIGIGMPGAVPASRLDVREGAGAALYAQNNHLTSPTAVLHNVTAAGAALAITSGRLGIGLQSPASQLHITGGQWNVGTTEGDLTIGNATYRAKVGVALGGAGAGDVRLRAQGGTNRLMLGAGASDVLTVREGRVGVGTIEPDASAKLDVRGDLRVDGNIALSGLIFQEGWQVPTLLNGWALYGGGYNNAGYFLDKNGIVHLRGLVRSGPVGGLDSTIIFNLPAGYRPAARELHVVYTSAGAGRCDIDTLGNVRPMAGGNAWFSLDGITFRAGTARVVVDGVVREVDVADLGRFNLARIGG